MDKLLRYRELYNTNGPNIVDIVGTLSRTSLPGSECWLLMAHCCIFLGISLCQQKPLVEIPGRLVLPRDNTTVDGMILVPVQKSVRILIGIALSVMICN